MMMVYLIEFLVIYYSIVQMAQSVKTVKIDHLSGVCSKFPSAPITLDDIRLGYAGRRFFLSMKINSRKFVGNDLMLQYQCTRCRSKEAPDTCEDYGTVNIRHMCDRLLEKHHIWSPLVRQIKPQLRCPLRNVMYVVNNGSFNADVLSALPVEGWYWKNEVRLVDVVDNKTLMCIYEEGQIVSL